MVIEGGLCPFEPMIIWLWKPCYRSSMCLCFFLLFHDTSFWRPYAPEHRCSFGHEDLLRIRDMLHLFPSIQHMNILEKIMSNLTDSFLSKNVLLRPCDVFCSFPPSLATRYDARKSVVIRIMGCIYRKHNHKSLSLGQYFFWVKALFGFFLTLSLLY